MLLKLFTKTEVKKNLTISVIGVAIGQVIHLLFTPLISRIYSPEQFGEYSLFLSAMGIISSISILKFDYAIITCEDNEVNSLYKITKKICFILFILILLILIPFYLTEHRYFKLLFFSAISVYIFNRFWTLRAILNKYGMYKTLSITKIIENLLNGFSTVALGIYQLKEFGLYIGKISGMLSAVLIFKVFSKEKYIKNEIPLKGLFQKYIKFPTYSFPAELINNLNFNSSIFLFSILFDSFEVGLLGLTNRVLSVPINFVSISFLDVFKQKAIEDFKSSNSFQSIFLKFLYVLSILAIFMTIFIYYSGPIIFNYIFGSEWEKAGLYAKYLVTLYSLRLILTPLAFSFEITGKNHINLYFETIYLILGISSVLVTYVISSNAIYCIMAYCFSLSVIYLVHLFIAYKSSSGKL